MNTRKAIHQGSIAIASLAGALAWGHPNHADPGTSASILHLVTEPDHLLALVAAAGVVIWAVRRRRVARKQRGD